MYCLKCGRHTKWLKTPRTRKDEDGISVRVWKCGTCGKLQNGFPTYNIQKGRELYFDLETCFNVVAAFDLRVDGYISPEQILKPSFIICWSAGWVGEKEIYKACVTPTQARKGDDSKIIGQLWKLLNEADVVIGHNICKFDIRKLNYRFLLHGYEPPTNYKTVDTLKIARKNFAAESNKMDYLSSRLSGIRKHDMKLQDWIDCSAGIPDALDRMQRYNENDVKEGIHLYQKMISWIPVQTGQIVRAEAVR